MYYRIACIRGRNVNRLFLEWITQYKLLRFCCPRHINKICINYKNCWIQNPTQKSKVLVHTLYLPRRMVKVTSTIVTVVVAMNVHCAVLCELFRHAL